MGKVYYRYGTMGSSKTANLLMTAKNYELQGKNVLLLTSAIDDRYEVGLIKSRSGVESKKAMVIKKDTDIYEIIKYVLNVYKTMKELGYTDAEKLIYCILVDESQFLSQEQVLDLCLVADEFDIPVICYGLKTDFTSKLFEGSEALLRLADKIEEIKTTCYHSDCNSKATQNIRLVDGEPVFTGEQILIGDSEYLPVCRKHYFEKFFKKNEKSY